MTNEYERNFGINPEFSSRRKWGSMGFDLARPVPGLRLDELARSATRCPDLLFLFLGRLLFGLGLVLVLILFRGFGFLLRFGA
jgi:hypothetical protein